MAGDIDVPEVAVVLGEEAVSARSQAASAVQRSRGRILHAYGPRVFIAEVSPSLAPAVSRALEAGEAAEDPHAMSAAARSRLDETGLLGLDALALRQTDAYAEAKLTRPLAEEDWDTGLAKAPDFLGEELGDLALAGAATSARLMGSVAVGLILVEGPTAALKFSAAERLKVVAEVQNGLGWLGAQSGPAGVSWSYEIKTISLDVQPGPASLSFEQKEARWRDPAMAQLGFGPGLAGVQAYVQALRTKLGTNWAYCAFFTKYPLGWFAYASLGGPRLVMHYDNDGWGPDNIDRVFAHETGHIFNAPDEYKASNCNCGGQWGYFKQPNGNCESCAPGGGVDCIMKGNSWAMCPYTPFHLGFPQGVRYSGVFRQGTGAHALWLNADWNHFVAKWQQLSSQGLRLIDLDISKPGSANRYSGVFRQGNDAHGLWVNATWSSFVAKWQEWTGKGLRLIDLEITGTGSAARYSGVFRQGTDAHGLWVNATWSSFVAKWQEWTGKGLRLVDFEIAGTGADTRYSGVFRQGTGKHGLWVNATWSSFVAKWQEWSAQGMRLLDLEISGAGSDKRYSGVFGAGTESHALWVNADWASFKAKWQALSAQGLRLVDFEVTSTGIETLTSPRPIESTVVPAQLTEGELVMLGTPMGAGAPLGGDRSSRRGAVKPPGPGSPMLDLPSGDSGLDAGGGVGFSSINDPGTSGASDTESPAGTGLSSLDAAWQAELADDESGRGYGFSSLDLPQHAGDPTDPDDPAGFGISFLEPGDAEDELDELSGAGFGLCSLDEAAVASQADPIDPAGFGLTSLRNGSSSRGLAPAS